MLKNISSKNGKALLCIAFSFLLSNASLEAVKTYRGWNPGEDHLLRKAVDALGTSNWETVAEQVPNRTAKQCRERWSYYSSPAINDGLWTEAEERSLMHLYLILGRKWEEIAKHFPGRTDKQCKCHLASLVANRLGITYRQAYSQISRPRPSRRRQPRVPADRDGAAETNVVDPADPRPSRCRQPRVPAPASDDGEFAFPISPSEPASDNEESDSSTSPLEREPAGRYEHGDPDAVADVAGLAPPPPPPAPRPAPCPAAVAGEADPANPPPALLVPVVVQTRVPMGRIFDSKTYEFFEKLRNPFVSEDEI